MTCNITGVARLPDGTALIETRVVFQKLSGVGSLVDGSETPVVFPARVEIETDASGLVDFDLYYGQYEGKAYIQGRAPESFLFGVPNEDTADFGECVDLVPEIDGSVVSGVVLGYAEDAQTSAENAGASAAAAANSAAAIQPYASRAAAEAADVAATVDKISLIVGNEVLDYQRDAGGDALTTGDGAKWSPAGIPSAAHWDLPFDESSDAAPAIKSAVSYAAANGFTRAVMPASDKVFVCKSPIEAKAGVTLDLRGTTLKKGSTFSGSGYLFDARGSFDLAEGNTLASDASAGDRTVTLSSGKGANIPEDSWILIASDGSFPVGQCINSLGQWVKAVNVVGDTVKFSSDLMFDFTTADNAEIFVPSFLERPGIVNGFIDGEGADTTGDLLRFEACLEPVVKNVHGSNMTGNNFVYLEGCVGARVDVTAKEQYATSYAVVEVGPNLGAEITVSASRVRHAYTTVATKTPATIPENGVPTGSRVVGIGNSCAKSAFDTHEDGWGINFDVTVIGGEGHGVQVRAPYTTVKANVHNTRGAAVYLVSDRADNCTIDYVKSWRTNQGGVSDDDSTDMDEWKNRGSVTIHANQCYVADFDIQECGGPGIQLLGNAIKTTLGSGQILNPCQVGTSSTAAIDSEYTGSGARCRIAGMVVIESTDGNMDYCFAVDDADATFIGRYFSGGAAIGEFDDGGTGATLTMERVRDNGLNAYDGLLVIDSVNRRVGIGEGTPQRALHVDIGADNEAARFESSDVFCLIDVKDSGGTIQFGVIDGDPAIRANNNDVLRYDVSGNRWVFRNDSGTEYARFESGKAGFSTPVQLPSYTVAGVPSASSAGAGATIYVTDETGGAVLAFSDGTDWRRSTDRAVIS